MKQKIALVTGATRGMGLATSEKLLSLGYRVILVGRNADQLKSATDSFVADLSSEKDIQSLINYIKTEIGQLDVLINNAGIYIEEGDIFTASSDIMKSTLAINTMAPYLLMKGLIPLMQKNGYGRVVNVSSGLGSFEGAASHCLSYSVSKASLNMLTNLFAQEVSSTNIKINSVCPGWVRTDMGGKSAPRSIEEGISGIVWAATLSDDGPSGGFFRDGKSIEW